MPKKLQSLILVPTLTAILTATLTVPLHAASPDPVAQQIQQDAHQLEGLEGEITSIADRIKEVQQALTAADTKKTEVRKEADKLAIETDALIPDLYARAEEYRAKRDELKKALVSDYKEHQNGTLELIVESRSVAESLSRASYTGAVKSHLDALAESADKSYDQLQDHKDALDLKRSKTELLHRQLEQLEASVGQQRAELEELLANRNNEAQYLTDKIARAKLAQDEILKGSASGALWGTFADGAPVKQGEIIGFEGSTGFSTGCHLHFSVIENGRWVNPTAFWAVLKAPDGSLTQPYGMTDYARSGAYGGGIHNGIDYVHGCGQPIRAAADGVVIRDNRTDGSGFGHYIMIRHNTGLITLYGHML